MKISSCITLVILTAAAFSQPALAERVAIDTVNGISYSYHFNQYCDYDGSNCGTSYTLPYSLSFDGGSSFTNALYVRGDGRLNFGGTGDYNGITLDPAAASNIVHFAGTTPMATVSAGTYDNVGPDYYTPFYSYGSQHPPILIYDQSATITTPASDGSFSVDFFSCFIPPCQTAEGRHYSVTFKPVGTGLQIDATYFNGWASYLTNDQIGYTTAAGTSSQQSLASFGSSPVSFLLPALFDGPAAAPADVPEPGAAALFASGVVAVGLGLRRRRQSTV